MQTMILGFLTSSLGRELGKRLFLLLAKEYVESTDNKLDDRILKELEDAMK